MKRITKASIAFIIAIITVISCIPFSVSAAEPELLSDVQGTLPDLKITVDSGYSIDTIHADKEAKIRAHVKISGAWDSSYNMSSTGVEMKTRGNSTFGYPKKPYQIKFDNKTDMFGMGAAKKWVLLANFVDGSFIRNKIVFDMAENMGMPYVCKSVFVNLYINNKYMGLYQLCEKVEIGDNRVPLTHDWGLIAEMESAKRLDGEEFYFRTNVTGKPFVYKEYNTDFEETEDQAVIEESAKVKAFFEERINTLENELYNNGKNWELVESLIDVDSFIQFYFINELCENVDATLASTYFYIDGPDDVIHMGPLWDYDRCFYNEVGDETEFLKNVTDYTDEYRVEWFKMLFRYPEFVERANELYDTTVRPAFDTARINATIDAYQKILYPGIMKNTLDADWAIFHNVSEAEFFSNESEAAAYLANSVSIIKNTIAKKKNYMDTVYGQYNPVLSYQQNSGNVYTGGAMTDSANMTSFSATLQGIVDGGISYTAGGRYTTTVTSADGGKVTGAMISSLSMSLTGNVANYYSIEYRVYRSSAWSAWASDGVTAGGTSGVITRVQARLVEKKALSFGTVSFDQQDVQPIYAVVGNKATLPVLESTDTKKFVGWYETDSSQIVTETTVKAEETTYKALFEEIEVVIVLGDANGDGEVKTADSLLAKRIAAGIDTPTPVQEQALDVNGDGYINAADTNLISRFIAGIIIEF